MKSEDASFSLVAEREWLRLQWPVEPPSKLLSSAEAWSAAESDERDQEAFRAIASIGLVTPA